MKGLRIALLIAAFVGIAVFSTSNVWSQGGTTTTTVPPQVTSRAATINNMQVGEVLVGDNVVLRIHQSAGGLTPVQRAGVVANRLSTSLAQGNTINNVQVGQLNGQAVLMMGNDLLITADRGEANLNNSTPVGLAVAWQRNLQTAFNPGGVTTTVAGSQESWPAWTNPTTKIVPIIELGTQASLGFAQITGPSERVSQVKAVLQLSAVFEKTARIFAFVPSSELTGLNRVQGVAVTALLQYTLFRL